VLHIAPVALLLPLLLPLLLLLGRCYPGQDSILARILASTLLLRAVHALHSRQLAATIKQDAGMQGCLYGQLSLLEAPAAGFGSKQLHTQCSAEIKRLLVAGWRGDGARGCMWICCESCTLTPLLGFRNSSAVKQHCPTALVVGHRSHREDLAFPTSGCFAAAQLLEANWSHPADE
jgi:hypothetical protein